MKIFCECNSMECDKTIELPFDEVQKIRLHPNSVIIVEGCPRGPESTDVFVEKKEGYSMYTDEGDK